MKNLTQLSANYNGSILTVIQSIEAAKNARADCIKMQSFTTVMITLDSKEDDFIISQVTLWDRQYLHDLYLENPFTDRDYI